MKHLNEIANLQDTSTHAPLAPMGVGDSPPTPHVTDVDASAATRPTERTQFSALARLAAAVSRPFDHFSSDNWSLDGLSAAEARRLWTDDAFARAMVCVVSQGHGSSCLLTMSASELRSLASTSDGRLAVLIVSEPIERIEPAALLCAAASMQRHVLCLAHKMEREAVRLAFGGAAYHMATQEAPILYPGLARLDIAGVFQSAVAAQGAVRERLLDFGLLILFRIVATVSEDLAELMRARFPRPLRSAVVESLAPDDLRQLTKLIHRRIPLWSATIA